MTTTLTCTHDQYHGLHEALAKVRSTTTVVKVDRDALAALLVDHTRLMTTIRRERLDLEGDY